MIETIKICDHQWINVDEGLPEYDEIVLTFRKNVSADSIIKLAFIPYHHPIPKEDTNFIAKEDGEVLWQVVYWMRIPPVIRITNASVTIL